MKTNGLYEISISAIKVLGWAAISIFSAYKAIEARTGFEFQ